MLNAFKSNQSQTYKKKKTFVKFMTNNLVYPQCFARSPCREHSEHLSWHCCSLPLLAALYCNISPLSQCLCMCNTFKLHLKAQTIQHWKNITVYPIYIFDNPAAWDIYYSYIPMGLGLVRSAHNKWFFFSLWCCLCNISIIFPQGLKVCWWYTQRSTQWWVYGDLIAL